MRRRGAFDPPAPDNVQRPTGPVVGAAVRGLIASSGGSVDTHGGRAAGAKPTVTRSGLNGEGAAVDAGRVDQVPGSRPK